MRAVGRAFRAARVDPRTVAGRIAVAQQEHHQPFVIAHPLADLEGEEKLRTLRAAIDEGLESGMSERTIEDIIADRRKRDGVA